jgi:DNA (cytosine-5)-methyltransferase 1
MTCKIFSFFSGAGFLDLGFEDEGFDVVYVNEFNKPFLRAYKYARNHIGKSDPVYGYYPDSITDFYNLEMNATLAGFVVQAKQDSLIGFIGGPPCPDFSIGGKNRGKHGENGKLSQTYVDLITHHKPDFFLFENVKGLYRTAKHRVFYDSLKRQLNRSGYKLTERVVNAIEYGAPQDRERIILLGFRDSIIPKGKPLKFPWEKHILHKAEDIFSLNWVTANPFESDSILPCPEGIIEELTVEHWFKKNEVTDHANAMNHFQPRAGLNRFLTVSEGDDSKKSFKRLHRWRYSPTAAYGNNEVHLHPYKARRISAAEALAIQSLPKDFILPLDMTLSDMFKTIGNGVPFLAAKSIARSLNSFLEEQIVGKTNSIEHCQSNFTTTAQPGLQLY